MPSDLTVNKSKVPGHDPIIRHDRPLKFSQVDIKQAVNSMRASFEASRWQLDLHTEGFMDPRGRQAALDALRYHLRSRNRKMLTTPSGSPRPAIARVVADTDLAARDFEAQAAAHMPSVSFWRSDLDVEDQNLGVADYLLLDRDVMNSTPDEVQAINHLIPALRTGHGRIFDHGGRVMKLADFQVNGQLRLDCGDETYVALLLPEVSPEAARLSVDPVSVPMNPQAKLEYDRIECAVAIAPEVESEGDRLAKFFASSAVEEHEAMVAADARIGAQLDAIAASIAHIASTVPEAIARLTDGGPVEVPSRLSWEVRDHFTHRGARIDKLMATSETTILELVK